MGSPFNTGKSNIYESAQTILKGKMLMPILLAVVLFAVGVALIIRGGDIFVDAAAWVSDVSGVSKAVIGATLVSFATTAPEYFVSLIATIKGYNDLSVGNAVGSLICNLGVAFAMLAICTPGKIADKMFGVKGLIMIAAAASLLIFCVGGTVSVAEGLVLLAIYAFFTFVNIRYSRDGEVKKERKAASARDFVINIAKFIGGAAAIILGSNFIVDNAQVIAAALGVPESIIGLTVVAIGTSLPEIVTSVAAIIKKQNALSIGNIIGANILDTTLILSTGAFVSGGLAVSQTTINTDLPVTLAIMALAVLPSAIGRRIYRWQGALMLAVYAGYLLFITVV